MPRVPDGQALQSRAAGTALAVETGAEQDLRDLFGQSPAVFASLVGPAHMVEAANPTFFAAIGGSERVRTGLPLGELMPELAEQGYLTLLDRVYRSGRPHTGRDVRVLLGTGSSAREAFFDFTYEPRTDAGGNVIGVRVVGVETTQIKHAQRLTAEHRALLEQIARQAPIEQVLEGMARVIEDLDPGEILVSVLLADADGRHLRHGAAPSLPDFYNRAIDGIATGEGVGSCGTAAHRRETVIVSDIATDPFWDDFRDLADAAGVAACWSTPILGRDGSLLGTFAMYHRSPRAPQDFDLALARVFAGTAALAIERHQAEQARLAAEAKEEAARRDLAFLLEASTALSARLDHSQTLQRLAAVCVPTLAPLCAVDIVEAGQVRRIAAAARTEDQRDVLASHRPVYDADDDAVARVLASGLSEVARRPPTGPGPWQSLGVTGYLCIPLLDRGRAFATLTLLSTGEHSLDGRTVALAEELARRAAPAALNARQYTQRVTLARDLQAGLLLPQVPALPGAEIAVHYHPAGEGLDIGGDLYDVFPLGPPRRRSARRTNRRRPRFPSRHHPRPASDEPPPAPPAVGEPAPLHRRHHRGAGHLERPVRRRTPCGRPARARRQIHGAGRDRRRHRGRTGFHRRQRHRRRPGCPCPDCDSCDQPHHHRLNRRRWACCPTARPSGPPSRSEVLRGVPATRAGPCPRPYAPPRSLL